MSKEDGGLAFPLHYEVFEKSEMMVHHEGMSLRDYFATHGPWNARVVVDLFPKQLKKATGIEINDWIKDLNIAYADSMIKELKK